MSWIEKLVAAVGEIPTTPSPFTADQQAALRRVHSEAELEAALAADDTLRPALQAALEIEAFRAVLANDHEKLVALVGEAANPPDARRFAPDATAFTGTPTPGSPEFVSLKAPMRVPGTGDVESHLVERVTTRAISPLELAAFGKIVRMRLATAVLPKDKTQLTAIYASMAEYMVERGLVKEALQFLNAALSTLPETVPHREALLAEWKAKRTRWKRWSDQIAAGEALFKETEAKERSRKRSKSARRYAEAAQTLAAVARETDRDGLPFLVHQIMHAHYLEAAIDAALRLYQGAGSPFGPAAGGVGFEEEMQRLHRKSHEEIFWSPVGYDSIPNSVVVPEGAQIRDEILLAQKLCGFRWGHDDDVRLLTQTETIEVGQKRDKGRMSRILAMKQIANEVGECRIALSQPSDDPRRVIEARKHLDIAQRLMTTSFGELPPHFLKTLVREMELYLGRQAGGAGGQKGVGSGRDGEPAAAAPPAQVVAGATAMAERETATASRALNRYEVLFLITRARDIGWTRDDVDLDDLEKRLLTQRADESLQEDVDRFVALFFDSPSGRAFQDFATSDNLRLLGPIRAFLGDRAPAQVDQAYHLLQRRGAEFYDLAELYLRQVKVMDDTRQWRQLEKLAMLILRRAEDEEVDEADRWLPEDLALAHIIFRLNNDIQGLSRITALRLKSLLPIVAILEEAEIPYALIGGMATSVFYSEWFTWDIDLLVLLNAAQSRGLMERLGQPPYIVHRTERRDGNDDGIPDIIQISRFGRSFDLMRANHDFKRGEIARARKIHFEGRRIPVVTVEDQLLGSLDRARPSSSKKVALLLRDSPNLDWDYLSFWARQMGLEDELAGLRTQLETTASSAHAERLRRTDRVLKDGIQEPEDIRIAEDLIILLDPEGAGKVIGAVRERKIPVRISDREHSTTTLNRRAGDDRSVSALVIDLKSGSSIFKMVHEYTHALPLHLLPEPFCRLTYPRIDPHASVGKLAQSLIARFRMEEAVAYGLQFSFMNVMARRFEADHPGESGDLIFTESADGRALRALFEKGEISRMARQIDALIPEYRKTFMAHTLIGVFLRKTGFDRHDEFVLDDSTPEGVRVKIRDEEGHKKLLDRFGFLLSELNAIIGKIEATDEGEIRKLEELFEEGLELMEPFFDLERLDKWGYRFRKGAAKASVWQAKGRTPVDDVLVVVFPSPERAPLDAAGTNLKNRYIQTMSDASEAGLASLVLTGPAGDGRFLAPFATAVVGSRMGEFMPRPRTNRATFAGGSFREGINRAVRSFALTAMRRGEKFFTARLVADAIWTYEGYQTRVDGKDEPHAKQISLKNLLGNLRGEKEVVKMIRRWLDWPVEDWLSLDARVVLVWNGKEHLLQEGNPRWTLNLEITDSFPFGTDPKHRALARMRRVLAAPVPLTTSPPVSVPTEGKTPTPPKTPGPAQYRPSGIPGAHTWTEALEMRRGFASPRAVRSLSSALRVTSSLPSLDGRGLRGGWPRLDTHPLPDLGSTGSPRRLPSRERGKNLSDHIAHLAAERGFKKASRIAARLSDTALAALAQRARLEKVLVRTGYAWAKGGLGPWGRKIAPSDLLLLGLAALARSDQEVAAVLQKISPYPDKAIGAATSPTQAVLSPLLPGARSLPVIPIGR